MSDKETKAGVVRHTGRLTFVRVDDVTEPGVVDMLLEREDRDKANGVIQVPIDVANRALGEGMLGRVITITIGTTIALAESEHG